LARRRTRHFLKKRCPIIRGHFVQDAGDLFAAHGSKQLLLRVDVEVLKYIRS
jgi:hypothetical protein